MVATGFPTPVNAGNTTDSGSADLEGHAIADVADFA